MTENELYSVHAPIDTGVSSPVRREYSTVVLAARDIRRNARAMGVNFSLERAIRASRLNLTGLFDSSQLPQDDEIGLLYLRSVHPQQNSCQTGLLEEILSLPPLDLPKRRRPRRNEVTLLDLGRFGGYDADGEGGSPTGNRRQPAKKTLKNR